MGYFFIKNIFYIHFGNGFRIFLQLPQTCKQISNFTFQFCKTKEVLFIVVLTFPLTVFTEVKQLQKPANVIKFCFYQASTIPSKNEIISIITDYCVCDKFTQ